MTRTNASLRLAAAVELATKVYPGLANRPISPHTIRHTTAMHLLQAGVDISVMTVRLNTSTVKRVRVTLVAILLRSDGMVYGPMASVIAR